MLQNRTDHELATGDLTVGIAPIHDADHTARLAYLTAWHNEANFNWCALRKNCMENPVLQNRLHKVFRLILLLVTFSSPLSFATTVRMQTSLGDIDIQLMDTTAPATVENFLNYVTSGAYAKSFIHRSVPGFVIQGGGYRWNSVSNGVDNIPANGPVVNEFSSSRSNLRGTIAMAKLGNDPNSAASQWFFNLADNSANLDNQNGGFTVFGQVIGTGMQVVDAIAGLPIRNANGTNASGPFDSLPLITSTAGVNEKNLVIISSARVLTESTLAGTVVEFYNTNLDNYFITADASEAGQIDKWAAGPGWSRTGNTFKSGGSTPVCRFYGSFSPGPNSHFYTVDAGECQGLKDQQFPAGDPRKLTIKSWNFESLDFVSTPAANQACPSGTVPVYRAYNNGSSRNVDSNHRIAGSAAAIQEVVNRGWQNEGVVMCAPQ